jgi:hypothetical protein
MMDLKYSLVIEATLDPTFLTFCSPDVEGFTGVGHLRGITPLICTLSGLA